MSMRKVLVGGGSGFVGGAFVRELRNRGFHPVIITRSRKQSEQDVIDWNALKQHGFPKDTFAVVNLAGKNIAEPLSRWTEDFKREVFDSRIKTTRFLANLVKDSPVETRPKVFVCTSAIGFYPPSNSIDYDENSKGGGDSNLFTRLCSEWEAAGRLPEDLNVRKVTVRLGLVLGRTGGIVGNSFWPFYFGLGGPMGSGQQWFPWIHVKDCAGILAHAVECEKADGVLNATAPEIITNKQFAAAFGKALGRPACLSMPEFIVRRMFGEERAELFLKGQKVHPKRTLESGYKFSYPTIDQAAAEFARVNLTESEQSRRQSVTPSSWSQKSDAHYN
uniref:Epimerase family protein SDR39U1 n=1 Tax=Plectus sambesii TaxID=2011161 RepID=A0A914UTB8_9BILA